MLALAPRASPRAWLFLCGCALAACALLMRYVITDNADAFDGELMAKAFECEGLNDFQLSACTVQHSPNKKERHLERIARCEWREDPRVSYVMQFLSVPPDRTKAESCTVEEVDGDWLFVRLGPIFTRGGYSWENTLSVFHKSMFAKWMTKDELVVARDFVLGSADASGNLIGHPPLHQHHFHYYFDKNLNHMELNNHGDSDCSEEEEGVYCQYMEFPPSVAFYLPQDIGIASTVNDVRPAGSPTLAAYFFSGIFMPHLSEPRPRPITMQNLYLAPTHWMHSQDQYPVDTSKPSIMYSVGEIQNIDSVVSAWFHLHREALDSLWVVQGSVEDLGLDMQPWTSAREAFYSDEDAIPRFKKHLQTAMAAHPTSTKLLCAIGHEPGFLEFRRRWCNFDPPEDGVLKYAFVGFYAPRRQGLRNPYTMHTGFYVLTTTFTDAPTASVVYWERRPQYDAIIDSLASKFDEDRIAHFNAELDQ